MQRAVRSGIEQAWRHNRCDVGDGCVQQTIRLPAKCNTRNLCENLTMNVFIPSLRRGFYPRVETESIG